MYGDSELTKKILRLNLSSERCMLFVEFGLFVIVALIPSFSIIVLCQFIEQVTTAFKIFIVVFLVLLLLFSIFGVWYVFTEIKESLKTIKELKSKLNQLRGI